MRKFSSQERTILYFFFKSYGRMQNGRGHWVNKQNEILNLSQKLGRSYDSIWCELKRIESVGIFGNTHWMGLGNPNQPRCIEYTNLFTQFP